ncbi:MAG: glycosyl hydrolase [Cyanobacteria bacterium P01_E01_bin.6]
MVRKFFIVAALTCLCIIAVSSFIHQSPRNHRSAATSPSRCSTACHNKRDVLEKFNIALNNHKTISGLYAGDERMFDPHWWSGAPEGYNTFDQFVGHVAERTGELAGIIEVRFTSHEDERRYGDLDRIVNLLDEKVWQHGAIPAISDFTLNPWNSEDGRNRDIGEFDDLFTPRTHAYEEFHTELEFIATGLHQLQERGIPVLFRPFHENTGGWFWWGRRTLNPEEYQRLWHYTFDYLENTENLDNLIWVYGASTSHYELIPETYPGDDYVHIVGISNYGCNPGRSDVLESYATLKEVAPNKPFAFTEVGPERNGQCREHYNRNLIHTIENDIPDLLYFLNWFGPRAALALYPEADKVLQHPRIWNADDLSAAGQSRGSTHSQPTE